MMEDILVNVVNVIVGMAIGSVSGYAYAYFSGLKAIRKGMQLMLMASLDDMYLQFQKHPPTDGEKRRFEEVYQVYEKLAENGVMSSKHEEVMKMKIRES